MPAERKVSIGWSVRPHKAIQPPCVFWGSTTSNAIQISLPLTGSNRPRILVIQGGIFYGHNASLFAEDNKRRKAGF